MFISFPAPSLGWLWNSTSVFVALMDCWNIGFILWYLSWIFKSNSAWERLRSWQMPQGKIAATFLLFLPPLYALASVVCVSPTWWNCLEPQSTTLCLKMMVQITNTADGETSIQSGFTLFHPSFLWHLCSWIPNCLGCSESLHWCFQTLKNSLLFSFMIVFGKKIDNENTRFSP